MLTSSRAFGRTVGTRVLRRNKTVLASKAPDLADSAPVTAAAGRMLAWRVHAYGAGGPGAVDELWLEETRIPPLRAPNQLLVRVRAASINPLDVAMLGGYGSVMLNVVRRAERAVTDAGLAWEDSLEFPLVLGRDFVGEVVRVGTKVRPGLEVGQRVWGVVPPHRSGSHAQYVLAEDAWTDAAPDTLPDVVAGGALYAAMSACAAMRAAALPPDRRAQRQERALVLGLGGVGQMAVQLLAARDTHVTVVCAGEQREEAEKCGAARALDRGDTELMERAAELGPYSAVVDCAGLGGGVAAELWGRGVRFRRYVTLTSPFLRETDAHGALIGSARAAATLVSQNVALAGGTLPGPPAGCPPVRWAFFRVNPADIALLRARALQGKLVVKVQHLLGWRQAREGYRLLAAGGARGKTVLDFTAE